MTNRLLAMLLLGFCTIACAEPDFLVDADRLADHIEDENLVLLEVRYHPHRYYTVGHIPGAVQIWRFKDLGDHHATPPMRFSSHDVFQERLQAWGVNDDSAIFLHDDSRIALASRLYFMLELYGFNMEHKALYGGTLEWSVFNDMEKELAAP